MNFKLMIYLINMYFLQNICASDNIEINKNRTKNTDIINPNSKKIQEKNKQTNESEDFYKSQAELNNWNRSYTFKPEIPYNNYEGIVSISYNQNMYKNKQTPPPTIHNDIYAKLIKQNTSWSNVNEVDSYMKSVNVKNQEVKYIQTQNLHPKKPDLQVINDEIAIGKQHRSIIENKAIDPLNIEIKKGPLFLTAKNQQLNTFVPKDNSIKNNTYQYNLYQGAHFPLSKNIKFRGPIGQQQQERYNFEKHRSTINDISVIKTDTLHNEQYYQENNYLITNLPRHNNQNKANNKPVAVNHDESYLQNLVFEDYKQQRCKEFVDNVIIWNIENESKKKLNSTQNYKDIIINGGQINNNVSQKLHTKKESNYNNHKFQKHSYPEYNNSKQIGFNFPQNSHKITQHPSCNVIQKNHKDVVNSLNHSYPETHDNYIYSYKSTSYEDKCNFKVKHEKDGLNNKNDIHDQISGIYTTINDSEESKITPNKNVNPKRPKKGIFHF